MLLSKMNLSMFPIGVLVLLFVNNYRLFKGTRAQKLYNTLTALVACAILLDITAEWLADGRPAAGDFFVTAINILYYLLCAVIPAIWLLYVYASIYGNSTRRGWLGVALMLMPMAASAIITLTTPFTGLVFRVERGIVVIGSLGNYIITLLALIQMLYALIVSLYERHRASSLEKRRECLILALFSILPLGDLALNVISRGDWMLWPFYSVCLMILYINVQTGMITSDPLTGLNNRVEFDKYLDLLVNRSEDGQGFSLFIIDIDDFKGINDRFGHGAGDEALRRMADIMRETFGSTSAFFSRIGGDEFAMIIDSDTQPDEVIDSFDKAMLASAAKHDCDYGLTASIGCAVCASHGQQSARQIFDQADRDMYANKLRRRRVQ